MSQTSKRVTIDFPPDLYRIIKTFSAFNDFSVKDFVLKAVNKELSRNNIKVPNQETIETFNKTDNQQELEEFKDFGNFIKAVNNDINKD